MMVLQAIIDGRSEAFARSIAAETALSG